eukprot:5082659-Prymnesium_polylepis.1
MPQRHVRAGRERGGRGGQHPGGQHPVARCAAPPCLHHHSCGRDCCQWRATLVRGGTWSQNP